MLLCYSRSVLLSFQSDDQRECSSSLTTMRAQLPASFISLILLLLPFVTADPITIPFDDCFDEPESQNQKFNVDTVYAQVSHNEEFGKYLNLTVLGTSPQDIVGVINTSLSLGKYQTFLRLLFAVIDKPPQQRYLLLHRSLL